MAVKWPNDLLWNQQKICGIISERFVFNKESFLSLGIGLNVNTGPSDLENIGRPATSLKIITRKTLNRSYLLQLFISKLELALQKLKAEGYSLSQIAKMLNVSKTAVHNTLKKSKLQIVEKTEAEVPILPVQKASDL